MPAATLVYNATPTTLDSLEVDCTVSETHQADVEITEHPVEDSASVSDHMRPKQETVTISGIVTGTPSITGTSRTVTGTSPQGKEFKFTSSVPEDVANGALTRIEAARDTLYRIKDGGRLVTVVTGVKTYENMGLKSLTITRDGTTGVALHFVAVFVQVKVVSLKTTARLVTKTPAAKAKVNDGRKPTKEVDSLDPLRNFGNAVGNVVGTAVYGVQP